MAGRRRIDINDETVTVLHQDVAQVRESRLGAVRFTKQLRVRIGGQCVRVVDPPSPLEVDLRVTRRSGRWPARAIAPAAPPDGLLARKSHRTRHSWKRAPNRPTPAACAAGARAEYEGSRRRILRFADLPRLASVSTASISHTCELYRHGATGAPDFFNGLLLTARLDGEHDFLPKWGQPGHSEGVTLKFHVRLSTYV